MTLFHCCRRVVVHGIATICGMWLYTYLLVGGTTAGKAWFTNAAQGVVVMHNDNADKVKDVLPLLCLALPVLCTITAASVLLRSDDDDHDARSARSAMARCRSQQSLLPRMIRQRLDIIFFTTPGQVSMPTVAFWLLIMPLSMYAACNVHRHLQDHDTAIKSLSEAANAVALAALVGLGLVGVPVARHGVLLQLVHISPPQAVVLHQWLGRFVVVAAILHGAGHVVAWMWQGRHLHTMLWPSQTCWKQQLLWNGGRPTTSTDAVTVCNDATECTCYAVFRNLTGTIALLGLVMNALSSLGQVRRRCYRVFYSIHVVAAPLVLVMVIVHYQRAVWYLAGGLLYYAVSTACTSAERRQQPPVQILTVEHLGTPQRPLVAVPFAVSANARQTYIPGQYVRVLLPSVSQHWHPFTVNAVPGQLDQMRLIVRACGPFTAQLRRQCSRNSSTATMQMDGWYGTGHSIASLQWHHHDVVSIVAGGIGITPYLTLLHDWATAAATSSAAPKTVRSPQRIVLHWMCRDAALIDYVRREYFETLGLGNRNKRDRGLLLRVHIIIYQTSSMVSTGHGATAEQHNRGVSNIRQGDVEAPTEMTMTPGDRLATETSTSSAPFETTRFALSNSWFGNVPYMAAALSCWIALAVIWLLHRRLKLQETMLPRLASVAFLLVFFPTVAFIIVRSTNKLSARVADAKPRWVPLRRSSTDDDDDDTESECAVELGELSSTEMHDQNLDDSESDETERNSDDDTGDCAITPCTNESGGLTIEMRATTEQRPSVHEFLHCLDAARRPALMVCGPTTLQRSVVATARTRCAMRLSRCLVPESTEIAIYPEVFEL